MFSNRLQMKYIYFWCWAESNMHTLWCNFVYIVCQFAMLNFPSIMQALKSTLYKCEAYNFVTNRQKCYFERHITVKSSTISIFCSGFHSVLQSSQPFSNTWQDEGQYPIDYYSEGVHWEGSGFQYPINCPILLRRIWQFLDYNRRYVLFCYTIWTLHFVE